MKIRGFEKLSYYLKNFFKSVLIPKIFYRRRLLSLLELPLTPAQQDRIDYYCKIQQKFSLDKSSSKEQEQTQVDNLLKLGKKVYHWDLYEYLRYFPPQLRFKYLFGDVTEIPEEATLLKSRPISSHNQNSVLLSLDKIRHMNFIKDPRKFENKKNLLVWRGGAYQEHRKQMLEKLWQSPLCDVGQTNKPKEKVPWQKSRLSISEQLRYKFILSVEGNDVATNLKWALSSNSLVFMTEPKYETWFMEGKLVPGKHFVLLKENYSNLEQKIEYYSEPSNLEEAKEIINQAHQYVQQFQDHFSELLISLHVLRKYFKFSGQVLDFS